MPVPEGIISTSTGPVDPNQLVEAANSVKAVATEVAEATPAELPVEETEDEVSEEV